MHACFMFEAARFRRIQIRRPARLLLTFSRLVDRMHAEDDGFVCVAVYLLSSQSGSPRYLSKYRSRQGPFPFSILRDTSTRV